MPLGQFGWFAIHSRASTLLANRQREEAALYLAHLGRIASEGFSFCTGSHGKNLSAPNASSPLPRVARHRTLPLSEWKIQVACDLS